MKHALLVWLLDALQRKPTPLFVLDTHAGAGSYDLTGTPALRTGEAHTGIMRLLGAADPAGRRTIASGAARSVIPVMAGEGPPSTTLSAPAAQVSDAGPTPAMTTTDQCAPPTDSIGPTPALTRYLELVRQLGLYPGSPALIRALLRPDDRLACCELHPEDAAALRRRFARDRQVAVHQRDAWEALGALLPPREKRSLVLIDPPFEHPDEFTHLAAGLVKGHSRVRTGVFAAWYPIKHRAPVRAFHTAIQAAGIRDVVAAELLLREPLDPARLNGCGMLVINPPYRFETEASSILQVLLRVLGNSPPSPAGYYMEAPVSLPHHDRACLPRNTSGRGKRPAMTDEKAATQPPYVRNSEPGAAAIVTRLTDE